MRKTVKIECILKKNSNTAQTNTDPKITSHSNKAIISTLSTESGA